MQQAATLAANLAAKPDRWPEFRARLMRGDAQQLAQQTPKPLILAALALGWTREVAVNDLGDGSTSPPLCCSRATTPCRSRLPCSLDLPLGDPVYPLHPVRLMGATLSLFERGLRWIGADGYGGGIALFVLLAIVWVGGRVRHHLRHASSGPAGSHSAWHVFIVYSLLALGDLLHHVWRVERAVDRDDLPAARAAIAQSGRPRYRSHGRRRLPARGGREPQREPHRRLHQPAVLVRRSPACPGCVLFKIVSTMDSMVGYKTPRYLRFGWCGARLDDVMNYMPARLTWLAHRRGGAGAAGLFRAQSAERRPAPACHRCWVRTPAGARRRPPAPSSGAWSGRSGSDGTLVTDALDWRSGRPAGEHAR